jgi:cell division protease FtsH
MIMEWGMSEKLGRVRYNANEQEVFLGHAITQTTNISPETAKLVDDEVRRLIEEAEANARRILTEKRDELHALANGLLEYETLSGEEVKALLRGETIARPEEPPQDKGAGSSAVPSAGGPRPSPGGGGLSPEPQPGA